MATKCRIGQPGEKGIAADLSRKAIMFNVEESLKRLKMGYIDLYQASFKLFKLYINTSKIKNVHAIHFYILVKNISINYSLINYYYFKKCHKHILYSLVKSNQN